MASGIYPSFLEEVFKGNVNPHTGTFRVMIVGPGYTPLPLSHTRRSDITSEISATGYVAGGEVVDISVLRVDWTLTISVPATQWAAIASGATGRRGIVYHSRGGLATVDELAVCIDPNENKPTNGTAYVVSLQQQPRIVVATWS